MDLAVQDAGPPVRLLSERTQLALRRRLIAKHLAQAVEQSGLEWFGQCVVLFRAGTAEHATAGPTSDDWR